MQRSRKRHPGHQHDLREHSKESRSPQRILHSMLSMLQSVLLHEIYASSSDHVLLSRGQIKHSAVDLVRL